MRRLVAAAPLSQDNIASAPAAPPTAAAFPPSMASSLSSPILWRARLPFRSVFQLMKSRHRERFTKNLALCRLGLYCTAAIAPLRCGDAVADPTVVDISRDRDAAGSRKIYAGGGSGAFGCSLRF